MLLAHTHTHIVGRYHPFCVLIFLVDERVQAGMDFELFHLPPTITQFELLSKVQALNNDPNVHGILVQLPLPDHLDDRVVTEAIDPKKDVDG